MWGVLGRARHLERPNRLQPSSAGRFLGAYQDFLNVRDRVAFGQGPYETTPSYTDITKPDNSTDNAVRPGGTFATGRQNRNGAFEATSVTIDVGNRDGRYTPYFAGSPYYPLTEFAPYPRHVQ